MDNLIEIALVGKSKTGQVVQFFFENLDLKYGEKTEESF